MFHSLTTWLSDTNNFCYAWMYFIGALFLGMIINLAFIEEDEETNSVPPQIDLWN